MILRYFSFQNALRIIVRLARMNRQRLLQTDSMSQLARKDFLLDFARRVVVVIIETHLAPSNASWMGHGF